MKYLFLILISSLLFACTEEESYGSDSQTDKEVQDFIQNEILDSDYDEGIERTDFGNVEYDYTGEFNLGSWNKREYSNSYFSLKVHIPEDWHILNDEERNAELQEMKSELVDKDSDLEKKFDDSQSNWYSLLTLQQTEWLPWINFMGEKLEPMPEADNAIEYLEYCRWFFIKVHGNENYPIYSDGDITMISLADKKFLSQDFQIEDENGIYYQKTYSAQYGNYLLNIITNYKDESQLETILELLNSITWLDEPVEN